MPSPFPGMDPYLEGTYWMTFHTQMIAEIARQLAPKLRPRYLAGQGEIAGAQLRRQLAGDLRNHLRMEGHPVGSFQIRIHSWKRGRHEVSSVPNGGLTL